MEKLQVITKKSNCNFCGLGNKSFTKYGVMYKLGNIVAHYYCVLFSSDLTQNGKDEEGILGFLYKDIANELKNSSDVLCVYCNRGHASLKCSHKYCKKRFHYPCGLQHGSLSQFTGLFKSFCGAHSKVQNIPAHILRQAAANKTMCCICYEELNFSNRRNILWAPCCSKAFYHKICIQKHAYSAGYFFKCPACNDVKKFWNSVQKFGVFVPQQDASWERDPNAYQELLFKYNTCDAEVCLCPRGRQGKKRSPMWEVIVCESCGSQGIHVTCGGFKHSDSPWECSGCQKVTESIKSVPKSSESKGDACSSGMLKLTRKEKKRRRGSEDLENLVLDNRKKSRLDVQEEEIEIDVETVDGEIKDNKRKRVTDEAKDACTSSKEGTNEVKNYDPQDVLTSVRPGPLSYKMRLLQQTVGNFQMQGFPLAEEERGGTDTASEVSDSGFTDLIVLSDSEEDREADDDVEIIGVTKRVPGKHSSLISSSREYTATRNSNCNGKENSYNLVCLSSDCGGPQEVPHSLKDFDVLAVVKLNFSGVQKESCE